jgi:uncharacterized protein YabN with tetrapyrrole methylase and pyrophosphatase domain
MRAANRKFERRFSNMERILEKSGKKLVDCDLNTMDAAWNEAKALDKK